MRKILFTGALAVMTTSLAILPAAAQTTVRQIDADTLQVIDYSGKPPFQRRVITRDGTPSQFARFAELVDHDPQPLFASSGRAGPPGKSLPAQRVRVSGDAAEIAEFARFEESGEAPGSARRSHGAPGKGIYGRTSTGD